MFTRLLSGHTVTFDGAFICLEDSRQGRSITNAAEEVIRHLETALAAWPRHRGPIRRDLQGHYDQLLTRDGRFAGFKSLGGTGDLETAKARASLPVP
jgi:hypothetical protein